MNNVRRKAIEQLHDKLTELICELEELKVEEQEYLDNMPENMKSGDNYDTASNAVDNLDSAVSGLDGVLLTLAESVQ